MIAWILIFLFGAFASADGAKPKIIFPNDQPYSCRILHHRIMDRLKGHAGFENLNLEQAQDFAALLSRAGYFPKEYFQRQVSIEVEWILSPAWTQIMNSKAQVSVDWFFKRIHWQEVTGILPDEVKAQWRPADSTLQVSTLISPVELCFLPTLLRLRLSTADKNLELTSDTEWR